MFKPKGTYTALVTPFRRGRFDVATYKDHIKFQALHRVAGIVPVGTTGESPTLSHDEHHQVIETAVRVGHELRLKVIAGAGSNSTAEAVDLTRHAKKAGADAVLSVNPYYNKPTQEGLYRHFKTIAEAVDIPVVLYNIPGRTNVTMTVDTMNRLVQGCPNIVAVKDATGNLDMTSAAAAAGLTVLSGDDSLTLPMMAVGATGVISVVSNLVPGDVRRMVEAAQRGNLARARLYHQRLFALTRALFVETNPVPVKTALALLGRDSGDLRLPLCEASAASRETIRLALSRYGLL